jgi:antitoxin component of MazEF toxin-antitoxin module
VRKFALVKVSRHGNSAMCAIPRDLLFHLQCLFGDYLLLEAHEDGTITMSKGEVTANVGRGRVLRSADVPAPLKP